MNSSANKFKKTQVDVRSENASKFREMFDRGEAPEDEKTRMRYSRYIQFEAVIENIYAPIPVFYKHFTIFPHGFSDLFPACYGVA